ncbi:MAG: threonylcarbamoyl-AMP synthase [Bacteroidales bacterium]|nr:threonylcarbamoyl-AMP synthase [Bacteroidales bacterium]
MLKEVNAAIKVLQEGGLILYPTDTIWGIGCDATSQEAVQKIYKLKQREDSKTMLVLVNSMQMLKEYIRETPSMAPELISLSKKPLTIIYPDAINLAPNLINHDGTIGIRICNTPFCQKLISIFGKPLVSTSANITEHPYPKTFTDIEELIRKDVQYIVNIDQDKKNPSNPSSIIKLGLQNEIEIIRE